MQSVFDRVAASAGVRVSLGMAASVDGFCISPSAIIFGTGDLTAGLANGPLEQALATGRIAYAIGVWAAHQAQSAQRAGIKAAERAGCTLARLGVRGDDLTTQLIDLQEWSGPHANARRFAESARGGHTACTAR